MKRLSLLLVLLAAWLTGGCQNADSGGGGSRPRVGYVTNGIASFWVIAEKGARDAAEEFDVEVSVQMPRNAVEDQKRMVEDLLTRGVQGIAISPIDPENQADLLDQIAKRTTLITQDSDAPNSPRLCYVGMDNYTAGRMCGKLVKEALPDGGEVMLFVGRLGQANARLRRQGVIDELLDRDHDPSRYDEPGQTLRGENYVILDTRTDQFDFARAKELAEDAIAKYPDLDCMVGLFAYNPPKILEALHTADKLGKIQVVGFDEADETLQGILDGHVYGTVVQNPYKYGYESVRILAALARGDRSVLPEDGFVNIPARPITAKNAREFWDELKSLTGS